MTSSEKWPGKGLCGSSLSYGDPPPPRPLSHTLYCTVYIRVRMYIYLFTQGREGVLNQGEGERGNRGEYKSQSWFENTNMTECTQEIRFLQSLNSPCVELEKMPLITFWSKLLGADDSSIVVFLVYSLCCTVVRQFPIRCIIRTLSSFVFRSIILHIRVGIMQAHHPRSYSSFLPIFIRSYW